MHHYIEKKVRLMLQGMPRHNMIHIVLYQHIYLVFQNLVTNGSNTQRGQLSHKKDAMKFYIVAYWLYFDVCALSIIIH